MLKIGDYSPEYPAYRIVDMVQTSRPEWVRVTISGKYDGVHNWYMRRGIER